jgi:hypothetical protein
MVITTPIDIFGSVLAFLFTVLILLYAIGDNIFFRVSVHIFVGASAGYAGAIALRDVLIPRLSNLEGGDLLIPIVLILLLFTKLSPRTAKYGNPVSAFLVGVGAALAIGGAIQGTLIPQALSAGNFYNPNALSSSLSNGYFIEALQIFINGSILLIGTSSTLAYFHFGAEYIPNQIPSQPTLLVFIGKIGYIFIAITFGVIFAGIYNASLTALIERFNYLINFIFDIYLMAN